MTDGERPAGRLRDDRRAQLSLPAVEVAVGVLLVFGVLTTFALGTPAPPASEARLDAYATDTLTVLSGEPPRHQGTTRLTEVTRSPSAFARERASLARRVERFLPDNCLYRLTTPHGTVGYQRPAGVAVGKASVPTPHGPVTIRVWYV